MDQDHVEETARDEQQQESAERYVYRGRGPITRCIWGSNGCPTRPSRTHSRNQRSIDAGRILPALKREERARLLRQAHHRIRLAVPKFQYQMPALLQQLRRAVQEPAIV